MGAAEPRPCPEAEIVTAATSTTSIPNLDIAFVMAVEAEKLPIV
jgi:hypothetical protein